MLMCVFYSSSFFCCFSCAWSECAIFCDAWDGVFPVLREDINISLPWW